MLKTVPFQDRMEARHSDLNAIQSSTRATFDTLVKDAVTADAPGYAGFTVTKNSATELQVAGGRIYRPDGAIFEMAQASTRNIVSILPSATKRLVAVIAYGQEEDSRNETRDFLVDLESDTTEPRMMVVERQRAAKIDLIPGQESATLPRPVVDQSLIVIAWVTLNTTGIEAIAMEGANALPSVTRNDKRIRSLEVWRDQIEPRINTIASDITALKKGMAGMAGSGELINVMRDIARLKEKMEIPDDASDWASDRYLTDNETDKDNIDLLCLVEEGVRFSHENRNETQISLYNPLDLNAYVPGNGLLLPAISGREIRLASSAGAVDGSIAIAQYGFQTHEMKQLSVARSRLRYGPAYNVCNNSQWWADGVYDSATNTFKRNGETFLVTGTQVLDNVYGQSWWDPLNAHTLLRVQQFWEDEWNDNYWVAQVTDRTVSGAQIAQTILNSQDGWLSGLKLRFAEKGADGDVHISIAYATASGSPDPAHLVTHVTIPYADIKVAPNDTYVTIPPVFLEAGQRYALIVTTLGNHKVAVVDSNKYAQGTLFYSTDGAYYQGDLTRDLYFQMEYLVFKASRVEIELAALTLSGGIASIDILAGTIKPKSCSIEHQVMINGAWKPLNVLTPNLLVGLPPLLRHRVVMTGTNAVAPALEIPSSRIRIWRQRTTLKHISTRRTLATSATTITVQLIIAKFEADRHTIAVKLRKDDNTLIASSGFVDEPIDPGRFRRTYSFAATPAISAYKIQIEGTTNNALVPFHVEERVDVAL
jgi:hypothetical protein